MLTLKDRVFKRLVFLIMFLFLFLFFLCFEMSGAEKTVFELEPRFTNLSVFQNYKLGNTLTADKPEECASLCVANIKCSTFRYMSASNKCILFGNAVSPHILAAGVGPSLIEYFVNTKQGRCPLQAGYMLLREADMCVKIYRDQRKTYGEADSECKSKGGRLVVLEEELKANAILEVLQTEGLARIMIGLTRQVNNREYFIWEDGRTMERQWWNVPEPNGLDWNEDCAVIVVGGLMDVPCSWYDIKGFICEIIF